MIFGRRQRHLIHKLQYAFVLLCVSYVLFFLVVLGFALFAPLMFELRGDPDFSSRLIPIADSLIYLHSTFWPSAAVALIVISLHAIRTSHRLVGPLYRHRLVFQALAQGSVPAQVRLRKGDYLLDQTAELNAMLEHLRLRLAEIQEEHHQHLEDIEQLHAVAGEESREEIGKHLACLLETARRVSLKLDQFQIES